MVGLSQLIWKRVQSFITIQEVSMKKYQRMHLIFIRQYIKQIMEYKVDFVVGVLGSLLTQGLNLLFLNVIFQHIPSLEAGPFKRLPFIYGFSLIPKGSGPSPFEILGTGTTTVRKGSLISYLTRPINPSSTSG